MCSKTGFAAIVISLFLVTSVATADTKFKCDRVEGGSPYLRVPTPGYEHDRYGTLPFDLRFDFGGFISSFDSDDDDTGDGLADFRAVPEWVAYEIKRYGAEPFKPPVPSPARPNPWYEMHELDFLKTEQQGVTDRRVDRSYAGFGTGVGAEALGGKRVNRGHLAMKSHVQRIGWMQACNTHVFVNAIPQQEELNQGDWLALEAFSGAAANKFGQVWVIAGPIFDAGRPVQSIGHEGTIPVAVPDAVFKILVKENPDSKVPDVLAFIYPQPRDDYVKCSEASRTHHTYDHSRFLVSISEIEMRTGLQFFRNVDFKNPAARKAFKDFVPTGVWDVEAKFYTVTCGD